MPVDLYYMPQSSGARAILLTAAAIGVEVNLKLTDLTKGEHLTPEFLKLNPQHTIPTITDGDFSLWESRAIMAYLVNQYAEDDSLYPKDPQKRAVVDQRLYFDMGTLYQRFADHYYPLIQGGTSDPAKLEKIKEAFQFLETFLEGHEYAAGDQLTIADLTLVATVTTIEAVGFNLSSFSNVNKWLDKVKATAPGYEEANGKNVELFKEFYNNKLKKE